MPKEQIAQNNQFEKPTEPNIKKMWAHKLLLGISIAMLVIAIAGMIFCIINITKVSSLMELGLDGMDSLSLYYGVLIIGIILMILLIPPAAIGIFIYIKPNLAILGIVFGAIAVAIVLFYFFFALFSGGVSQFATFAYTLALAILPILYLICSIKIWINYKKAARAQVQQI